MEANQVTTQHRYEQVLRAVGQTLDASGIQAFELILDGEKVSIQGDPDSDRNASAPRGLQHFWRYLGNKKSQLKRLQLSEWDIIGLEFKARETRYKRDGCPETNSLSHRLRVIGAYIDKTEGYLLSVIRRNRLFAVRYRRTFGDELKEIFTDDNLYDLWVHLYKQRREFDSRNGTT